MPWDRTRPACQRGSSIKALLNYHAPITVPGVARRVTGSVTTPLTVESQVALASWTRLRKFFLTHASVNHEGNHIMSDSKRCPIHKFFRSPGGGSGGGDPPNQAPGPWRPKSPRGG